MGITRFSLILCFFFTGASSILASAPYPPTPSKERLDYLRELGRQNELKYGSGVKTSTVKMVTTKVPSPTTTPTPTATPETKITATELRYVAIEPTPSWWQKILNYFFSRWIRPVDTVVMMVTPTPTLTPAPTAIPTKIQATAQELWQKGFNVWVNNKDYAKASVYYQQALKINPDHVPTLASYGYILGAFYNKFSEGEAMLKKAMQLDPSWAYAPYNLGLLYDISGKREEGIYWLQYTVDHFPDHPDIEWFKDHLRVAKEWKY